MYECVWYICSSSSLYMSFPFVFPPFSFLGYSLLRLSELFFLCPLSSRCLTMSRLSLSSLSSSTAVPLTSRMTNTCSVPVTWTCRAVNLCQALCLSLFPSLSVSISLSSVPPCLSKTKETCRPFLLAYYVFWFVPFSFFSCTYRCGKLP